jgi:hypothetical protein
MTPTKLNSARTVSDIVNADIKSDAAIAGTKIAPNFGSQAITAGAGSVIGGNTSTDALRITQEGAGNALVIEDSTNPDATPFVVTADGSVGIGTAPSTGVKLDVVGGIRSALLNIIDGAAATYRFLALNTNNVARWHVGTTDDAESGSNAGSNFFLHRWSDNGTFLERVLHISRSTGNIGINTTSPTARLTVAHNDSTDAVRITQTGSGNALVVEDSANPDATPFVVTADGKVGVEVQPPSGSVSPRLFSLSGMALVGTNLFYSANLYFDTAWKYAANGFGWGFREDTAGKVDFITAPNNTSGAGAAASVDLINNVTFDIPTQRLGVGTRNPTEKLEVNGTVKATAFSGPLTGNVTGTASAIADGSVSTAKIVDGNVTLAKLVTAVQQSLVPAGAVQAFAMNSAPAGWLAADGTAVSRSTYAALFSAIDTTYGAGDGSTTFALPDLRGIFVRGSGSQTISGITYNKTFAAKETDGIKDHNHRILYKAIGGGGGTGAMLDGTGSLTYDVGMAAGTSAAETRPANIALLYCIKF